MITEYDLKRHKHYALLTDKEKIFISAYIETGGDTLGSLRLAYKFKTSKAEKQAFRAITNRPQVVEFIEWIDGEKDPIPDKDKAVRLIWKAAKDAQRPSDVYRGIEILSDILGWDVTPKVPDPKEDRLKRAEQIEQARLAMNRAQENK